MIIDSLRADFVLNLQNGSMHFVSSLTEKGRALPFLAKVHPPTVTLPRIKAITTGDIPGFVDVVLNFGVSGLQDDNILTQFKMANMSQVFFGDDTWISLFPNHFLRFDGTTSFFVTDYTEVDNNVTRHLDSELVDPDWDVMILHYLGLDHIGHLSGPTSPLIAPKLIEMDIIVEKLYTAMEKWSETESKASLLVICGDHGMSNQGGHGGASVEETTVPVILASPALNAENKNPEAIFQTDLAPTMATVMGVPIPKNNLGRIILTSLIGYTVEDKVRAFQINAFQVSKILQQNIHNCDRDDGFQVYKQTEKRHAKWLNYMKNNVSKASWDRFGHTLIADYQHSVRQMASRISATSTTYDLYSMIIAIAYLIMVFLSLCILICAPETFVYRISSNEMAAFGICYILGLIGHVTLPCFCFQFKSVSSLDTFLMIGTFVHTVSLLSSSFVEEEHQTWYFYSTTIHVMILAKLSYQQVTQSTLPTGQLTEQSSVPHSNKENKVEKNYQLEKDVKDGIFTKYQNPVYSDSSYCGEVECLQKDDSVVADTGKSRDTGKCSSGVAILCLWLVLVLLRILRTWNQTGDKWHHLPDVGDWLVRYRLFFILLVCTSLNTVSFRHQHKLLCIHFYFLFYYSINCTLYKYICSFCRPENKSILSGTVIFSMLCIVTTRCLHRSPFQTSLFIWAMICVYSFRAANGAVSFPGIYNGTSKGTLEAQMAYVTIVFLIMEALVTWIYFSIRQVQTEPRSAVVLWDRVQTIWLTLITLLLRPHNSAVLAMLSVTDAMVSKYVVYHIKQPSFLLLYCMWMGEAAFFFQGNSNSLTSVDVTAGYAGLVDYQPLLIGLLMFAATYAGPVFWLLSFFKYINTLLMDQHLETYKQRLKSCYRNATHTLLLTQTLTLVVYTVMVTIERYHLFVWTVFSPKLLYEGTRTVVVSLFSWTLLLLSDLIA
ncbi:GPI ethanolamine phosphate transferase 2-like [Gigantopelta aegis]|uniref:GPI ethanolamine phosphate transferase 2-like n=1 Tax=Gigantopelta aegis TaxID=1735272 RepID=UPI001B88AF4A|nr:GPI ethanolamine phosphate transferase 2-like [Gigantopelta aegis]